MANIRAVGFTSGLLLAAVLMPGVPAFAGSSDLDASWGTGGKVTTDLGADDERADALALYPPGSAHFGKVVAGGFTRPGDGSGSLDFALVRYNADGSLDPGFGGDGIVTTDFGFLEAVSGLAIGADDRIVAAGTILPSSLGPATGKDFALARYNPDGTLDQAFGSGGRVTTHIAQDDTTGDVTLQPDGKIVVAGTASANFAVVRYATDGSLDPSFGADGKVTTDFTPGLIGGVGLTNPTESHWPSLANGVDIQRDGKIVAAGAVYTEGTGPTDFAVARYHADGSLDTSYGSGGKVSTDFGSLDHDWAADMTLDAEDRVLAAGVSLGSAGDWDFALARYTAGGSLDSTFGTGGLVVTHIGPDADSSGGVAVQEDGKIVTAGMGTSPNDFALTRHHPDGGLDSTFGVGGIVTTDFNAGADFATDVATLHDGRLVAAGGAGGDFGLVRYGAAPGDLRVTGFTVADGGFRSPWAFRGRELTYTFEVSNLGPTAVLGVTLKDVFSAADVRFIRASAQCARRESTLTCDLGTLPGESQAAVTVVVEPKRFGPISNTATVSGLGADPYLANNTVVIENQVTEWDGL